MKLSLCMIVKDEIDRIERCLRYAKPFVDEVVIVDTGSTDGTYEVCRKYADKLLRMVWRDDFSAARNLGIEAASGDYIMILDADEWTPIRGNWESLRNVLEKESPDAVVLQVYNHLPGNQILKGDHIWQLRVFHNTPGYRYEGRVHNQIASVITRLTPDAKILKLPFRIEHEGYNLPPERLQQKFRERLASVDLEIAESTDEKRKNYYIFQRAKHLFMMKDFDETLATMRTLDLDKLTDENAFDACILGVHTSTRVGAKKEANVYASHAMDVWPWEPMALFLKGVCMLGLGRFASSRTILLGCLYYVENPQMEYKYAVDREYLAEAIGDACFHHGNLGEAKHFYKMHLTKYPENTRVFEMERNIVKNGEQAPAPQGIGEGKTIQPVLETD